MSVLQSICDDRRRAVALQRSRHDVVGFRESAYYEAPVRSLRAALQAEGLSVIAEHKRASPSEGDYGQALGPVEIAKAYQAAGASAISVLTEPNRFGGSLDHLTAIRRAVRVPILRKDFIVDAYQLHEAKAAGADAVLLIAAALTLEEATELRTVAHHLGLEVLLEVHGREELEYLSIDPDVIGINNRNLKTLKIDLATSEELYGALPPNATKISESGIATPTDALRMQRAGYDGLLVGTQFMKTAAPGDALAQLLASVRNPQLQGA